jgi:acetyltransferase-like isoleucine patch superfamily enzyme
MPGTDPTSNAVSPAGSPREERDPENGRASRLRLALYWLRRRGPGAFWTYVWMQFGGGRGPLAHVARRLAAWTAPPDRLRQDLTEWAPQGYISPTVVFGHPELRLGKNLFLDDRVVLLRTPGGRTLTIGDRTQIFADCTLETGLGGAIEVGADTFILQRCRVRALAASIRIGAGVIVSAGCTLQPFHHGIQRGARIAVEPLVSRGAIEIGDHAWLGEGCVVLSGVNIGAGAVIAPNSLVVDDVPENAIAAGQPARVVGTRSEEAHLEPFLTAQASVRDKV